MFFDLSWSHILLLLVVALVVVGPQDLPKIMRKAGQWTAKARAMADQFRNSFDEMARQSELDELRKEIQSLRNSNPLAETERALNDAIKIPTVSIAPAAAVSAASAGEAEPVASAGDGAPAPGDLAGSPHAHPEPMSETADISAVPVPAAEPQMALPFTPPAGEPVVVNAEPDKPIEGGLTPPAP
ncbi:MAG: Sec-independent protein translocase protein TatB [Rhizomicrobium sp.]